MTDEKKGGGNMIDNNNLVADRAKIICLLIGCPHGDTSGSCPLAEKKTLPFSELLEWVQSIPDAELQKILFAHYRCQEERIIMQNQQHGFVLRKFDRL